jgi:hypothetical protein
MVRAFTVADWISLAITEHAFIFLSDSYLSVHMFSRSNLLNVAIGFFQPILTGTRRSNLVQLLRRLLWLIWGSLSEPITARTNV